MRLQVRLAVESGEFSNSANKDVSIFDTSKGVKVPNLTYLTRVDPIIVANLAKALQGSGVNFRSTSELIRVSLEILQDIFAKKKMISNPTTSLAEAIEYIESSGLANLKKAKGQIAKALAQESLTSTIHERGGTGTVPLSEILRLAEEITGGRNEES